MEHYDVEEVGKELGSGAYGAVVEIKSPDGTIVAGKKLHDIFFESGNDPAHARSMKERFKQECVRLENVIGCVYDFAWFYDIVI